MTNAPEGRGKGTAYPDPVGRGTAQGLHHIDRKATMRSPLLLALVPLVQPALADDTVWVIDAAGGGDFTEIADAMPQTGEGWVLLVRPGTYDAPVTIANQGLTILADGTGPVVLTEPLTVRDLGFQRDVILSGLELREGFLAEDCHGLVRFQGCTTPPPTAPVPPPPNTQYWQWSDCGIGLSKQTVSGCRGVTFVDCELHGARGEDAGEGANTWDGAPGQHGLHVIDSDVVLYDCVLVGGRGGDALASGHFSVHAGAGGDGLHIDDPNAWARVCRLQASGQSGGGFLPSGNGSFGVVFGCDGADVRSATPTNVEVATHADLSLEAPPILIGATPAPLVVEGTPGAGVFLVSSNEPFWRPLHRTVGVLHLAHPLQFTSLGVIPSSGVLATTIEDPGPAAIDGFVSLQLQVFAAETGSRYLSQPRRVVVLHPGL